MTVAEAVDELSQFVHDPRQQQLLRQAQQKPESRRLAQCLGYALVPPVSSPATNRKDLLVAPGLLHPF